MKKILLASTALIVSAAAADAQALRIGGYGRMGLTYAEDRVNALGQDREWQQEHRLRLNFTVSVEGDNGLSFGAFTRAQASNNSTASFAASRVWVEAAGLRLTFGNTGGAISNIGYAGAVGIGYTGGEFEGGEGFLDASGIQLYSSTGGPARDRALLSYSFGDFQVQLSNERGGHTELAVQYSYDAFTFAAGATDGFEYTAGGVTFSGEEIYTISAAYDAGLWGVGLILADFGARGEAVTLTGSVELGGGTLSGYVGRSDRDRIESETDFGIGYSYGLGGGATIAAGYESVGERDFANIGVVFNF